MAEVDRLHNQEAINERIRYRFDPSVRNGSGMMSNATDGNIDQLVKAKWLALGLSQTDIFEVLNAGYGKPQKDGNGPKGIDADRMIQIAGAFDLPCDFFPSHIARTGQQPPDLAPTGDFSSRQALLELRLLRAFHRLTDDQTKLMLMHLAEQIVRRQAKRDRAGDAG
jgi:hypothetical protein